MDRLASFPSFNSRKTIKILVIEDELISLKILKAQLKELCDCQIEQATNLSIAMQKLDNTYDFVFTDMHLPDGLGLDFITAYRQCHHHHNVPIVIITADSLSLLTFQLVNQLGVDSVLQKPVSIPILENVLKRHFAEN